MPLNLQTNDGEYTPYIKYNAKAGRWYIRIDGQDGDTEIVNPTLVFDFANIRTGWFFFMEGMAPEKVWDPSPGQAALKPPGTKAFKRGFEVEVYGPGSIGTREFMATAGAMVSVIIGMYAEYEKGMAANPGKAPIFACTGVTGITGKYGTNYSPVFKLQGWSDRRAFENSDGSRTATAPAARQDVWTKPAFPDVASAVNACYVVGISKDEMIAGLKSAWAAKGIAATGWNSDRDSGFVRDMIAAKAQGSTEEPLEPPPLKDGEIPF